MSESENKFNCELCNFTCSKKSNWDRHCLTAKHIKKTNTDLIKENTYNKWKCECGMTFSFRSGYYRHKKKSCKLIKDVNKQDNTETLLKIVETQQQQIQELIMTIKNITETK